MLVARGRHLHQLAVAERKQVAVAAADALLVDWFAGRSPFPRDARGDVPGDLGLRWRTVVLSEPLDPAFDAERVRLEVFDARVAGGGPSETPLVSVDLVLSKPPPPSEGTRP